MNAGAPRGRLAPTPSGYLHLGNARSFLLAWLWARSEGGEIVMRVENIDLQRCKPELRKQGLDDLRRLGLDWDGEVVDQSRRFDLYRTHLQTLIDDGAAYPCVCSRKDIEEASSAPHGDEGAIYPGTCRDRWSSFDHAKRESGCEPAWRFRWGSGPVAFHDEIKGDVTVDPSTLGDFVLWRRGDMPSYQLAVTVDDALQGVTQVLRGRDLAVSTARQLALYEALGLAAPGRWAHVPFMQDEKGRRMAKRDGDLALVHLDETGADPARITGFLAWSAGLIEDLQPATAQELVGEFELKRISQQDFIVTDEHLNWLHS